jgi:tetratricopeptide (TPR) repeat protein
MAELHLAFNRTPQAVRAAQDALAIAREDPPIVVPAALVLVHAGRRVDALQIAKELAQQFARRSRAYAAIIEGEAERANRQFVPAGDALNRAQTFADLWLVHFFRGGNYVEAKNPQLAQGELDSAAKRWGEATAVFLDDVPSFRYLAPLPYWNGRALEGNGSNTAAADSYRKFLALRPDGSPDPLAADTRKRLQPLAER